MRLVFAGTPDFGVPSLEALHQAGHEIAAVITQPDRPAGRGQRPVSPPVKQAAARLELPVWQVERVSSPAVVERLRGLEPQAVVVVAFGQKIPPSILEMPPYGCINVHASLLPKYRGAAPIHWAILNGERVTGVTTMRMDEGWDTGAILLQRAVPVAEDETAGTLHDKLAAEGARLLVETLEGLQEGRIQPVPQDHSRATLAPKITREHTLVRWDQEAEALCRRVQGLSPWPGALALWQGRVVKLLRARPVAGAGEADRLQAALPGEVPPGTVLGTVSGQGAGALAGGLLVAAGGRTRLAILEIQPEGGRPMGGTDFANGYRARKGDRFGELEG